MSEEQSFDVIVVGAGPAGSMAATTLARAGHKVALIERGAYPGAKNLFGGMIYSLELVRHFPNFVAEAPIERPVTRHSTWFLGKDRSLNVDFASESFGDAPYNGFTAYRSRFDRWLADQAVAAGALLIPSTVVDDFLWENGLQGGKGNSTRRSVAGVVTRREAGELRAPLVICADGILSLLGRKAGLVAEPDPEHYSIGVRETLSLPKGRIEDRFQIDSNGGCAALFVGSWPGALRGGGFVYTNRDTLSVGFVAQMASLAEDQGKGGEAGILDALDAFKRHPAVRRLIQGAERLEYGAHVVPEGGWGMRPTMVGNGIMLAGDAAALVLAGGVIYEGVHYAMHSGHLAAETAIKALERGRFDAVALSGYPRNLEASYVGRNLKAFRHVPRLLFNPRMYHHYPDALCRVAEEFFRAEEQGHIKLFSLLKRHVVQGGGGLRAFLKDQWHALKAFFL